MKYLEGRCGQGSALRFFPTLDKLHIIPCICNGCGILVSLRHCTYTSGHYVQFANPSKKLRAEPFHQRQCHFERFDFQLFSIKRKKISFLSSFFIFSTIYSKNIIMKNTLKNILKILGIKHREVDSTEETRKRLIKNMKYLNPDFKDKRDGKSS